MWCRARSDAGRGPLTGTTGGSGKSGESSGRPESYDGAVLRWLLDAVFPPRCAGCRRLGAWFCSRCALSVRPPPPLAVEGLDTVYAGALLTGPIQQAIHEYKYGPRPQLARALAAVAATAVVSRPDAVVPVPVLPTPNQELMTCPALLPGPAGILPWITC